MGLSGAAKEWETLRVFVGMVILNMYRVWRVERSESEYVVRCKALFSEFAIELILVILKFHKF